MVQVHTYDKTNGVRLSLRRSFFVRMFTKLSCFCFPALSLHRPGTNDNDSHNMQTRRGSQSTRIVSSNLSWIFCPFSKIFFCTPRCIKQARSSIKRESPATKETPLCCNRLQYVKERSNKEGTELGLWFTFVARQDPRHSSAGPTFVSFTRFCPSITIQTTTAQQCED